MVPILVDLKSWSWKLLFSSRESDAAVERRVEELESYLNFESLRLVFTAEDAEEIFATAWYFFTPQEREETANEIKFILHEKGKVYPNPIELPPCDFHDFYDVRLLTVKMSLQQFFYFTPIILNAMGYPVYFCVRCSRPFIPRRSNQTKFCSPVCARSHHAILAQKRKKLENNK